MSIVYTLGTASYPFTRAIKWLQELLDKQIITEPVLLQHGTTGIDDFRHPLVKAVVGLQREQMHEEIKKASLVISHAGQGSTRTLASLNTPFVLIPRLKCYGEHVDDHQLLFACAVEKFGIKYCTEFEQLSKFILNPPPPFQGRMFENRFLVDHLIETYTNNEESQLPKRILPA